MAAPIPLRTDYDGMTLRRLAKASSDASQTRRLLALSVIYDGGERGDAATVGGVGLQVRRISGPCRRIMRPERASYQRDLGQRNKPFVDSQWTAEGGVSCDRSCPMAWCKSADSRPGPRAFRLAQLTA